jgi:hypothetical protein
LKAFASNKDLQVEAQFSAVIRIPEKGTEVETTVFAIRGATQSLLGRDAAMALGVLKIGLNVNVCQSEVIETELFPKVPNEQVHFDVDESVVPTKNAYYSVPAAFRQRARDRLKLMEDQGIIETVSRAPRWISGMSLVPKGKEDFRLVVNMRGPNKAIRRAYHPLPTMDEMRARLSLTRNLEN